MDRLRLSPDQLQAWLGRSTPNGLSSTDGGSLAPRCPKRVRDHLRLGPRASYSTVQDHKHFDTSRDTRLGWSYTKWSRNVHEGNFAGGRSSVRILYQGRNGGLYTYKRQSKILDHVDLRTTFALLPVAAFASGALTLALTGTIWWSLGILVLTILGIGGYSFYYQKAFDEYILHGTDEPEAQDVLDELSNCDQLTHYGRALAEQTFARLDPEHCSPENDLYSYSIDGEFFLYERDRGVLKQFDKRDALGSYLSEHYDTDALKALYPQAEPY